MTQPVPVRDAASVILVRDRATHPKILMGQRSRTATFMPGVYVFPGGAVDDGDPHVPLLQRLNATCAERLREGASDTLVSGLQAAAIREVSEETGLLLGQPGIWSDNAPAGWENFQKKACKPCARGFRFVFRAITPVGPPRRFDARFFLVNADLAVYGEDLDDFSDATDELSNLRWVPLDEIDSLRIALRLLRRWHWKRRQATWHTTKLRIPCPASPATVSRHCAASDRIAAASLTDSDFAATDMEISTPALALPDDRQGYTCINTTEGSCPDTIGFLSAACLGSAPHPFNPLKEI